MHSEGARVPTTRRTTVRRDEGTTPMGHWGSADRRSECQCETFKFRGQGKGTHRLSTPCSYPAIRCWTVTYAYRYSSSSLVPIPDAVKDSEQRRSNEQSSTSSPTKMRLVPIPPYAHCATLQSSSPPSPAFDSPPRTLLLPAPILLRIPAVGAVRTLGTGIRGAGNVVGLEKGAGSAEEGRGNDLGGWIMRLKSRRSSIPASGPQTAVIRPALSTSQRETEEQGTHHGLDRNDIDESINDLRQSLRHDPTLPPHNDVPTHTLFPPTTLPFHSGYPRTRFTSIIDVRFGALKDLGTDLECERGETGLDVCVEGVEE
jgi:hypothetical protein